MRSIIKTAVLFDFPFNTTTFVKLLEIVSLEKTVAGIVE